MTDLPEISDSAELMGKLRDYAETLGWELVEWDWKDDIDGDSEYQIWVRPMEERA